MPVENFLRECRQSEGKTVAELSRAADVSDKTIRKIETRKINGKIETRLKIVKGLNKLSEKPYQAQDIFPNN